MTKQITTADEARRSILDSEINGPVAEQAMRFYNAAEANVDEVGDVWIAGPMTGHWLSDDELVRFANALNRGF